MDGKKEQAKTVLFNILSVATVAILWTLFSAWQNSPFFPPPSAIWKAFVGLVTVGDIEGIGLFSHIWASLIRIFAGFAAACVLGIPLGLAMALWPKLYNRTRSVIEPIRFIPPIAWIPMAIVLLVGFSRYAFLIWLGAFFPIFITTLLSVTRVNPVHVNVVKVFGAKRSYIIRKIVIPSVLPDIATGMRVGLGIAWMCIVAAEMIGGEMVGIGRLILKYAELIRMGEIIVGMLIIGVIGFIMNEIFIIIEPTGVANPGDLKADFQLPLFRDRFQILEQVCILDASSFEEAYGAFASVEKQIAASSLFLINKTDTASREQIERIKEIVRGHNPSSRFIECTYCNIPVERLLGRANLDGASEKASGEKEW